MRPIIFILLIAACVIVLPVSALYQDSLYLGIGKYNESFPGERNAGQWYSFNLINASGYADVNYRFTVADAEFKDFYQYRSDAWGQWVNATPDAGKKYLFVWITGYSEGTSWIGWGPERFAAWINTTTIAADQVTVSDIGKVRRGRGWSNKVPPRTIRGIENKSALPGFVYTDDAYGYKDGIEQTRMEPGKSNAYYGYLIYQIPQKTEMKDIRIAGWFGFYGTAIWNLQPRAYTQQNPEFQEIKNREQQRQQVLAGQRLSDRDVAIGRGKV